MATWLFSKCDMQVLLSNKGDRASESMSLFHEKLQNCLFCGYVTFDVISRLYSRCERLLRPPTGQVPISNILQVFQFQTMHACNAIMTLNLKKRNVWFHWKQHILVMIIQNMIMTKEVLTLVYKNLRCALFIQNTHTNVIGLPS